MRFSEAMDAADRWGHFDGTEPRPKPKLADKPTDDELNAQKLWDREDKIGRNLLLQRLPDTTAMRLRSLNTAQERWTRLSQEFKAKMIFVQNNLQQAFFDVRCPKNGDVRVYLQGLAHKREELAAAGVTVSETDYQRAILRGIPDNLARFASQLLASARFSSASPSVYIDNLIIHICKEADRTRNRQPDEALASTTSEAGKKNSRKGNCHYCGKAGHWARECRKKPAEEEAQNGQNARVGSSTTTNPETTPVGGMNAASEVEGGDGFWMVTEGEKFTCVISADPDPLLGDEVENTVDNGVGPNE
jgi:gag-polypeptide of LTR copia-type/Zinc knuckle